MITSPLTDMFWFAAKMVLTLAAAGYDKTQHRAPRSMYAIKNGKLLPRTRGKRRRAGNPRRRGYKGREAQKNWEK